MVMDKDILFNLLLGWEDVTTSSVKELLKIASSRGMFLLEVGDMIISRAMRLQRMFSLRESCYWGWRISSFPVSSGCTGCPSSWRGYWGWRL